MCDPLHQGAHWGREGIVVRIVFVGAVILVLQATGAASAAEDLGNQVERCLTMPQGTKDSIPLLQIRVDESGAVLNIGVVGEPPVSPWRRLAIQAAARAIKRCSPYVVPAPGIYPVTIGGKRDDSLMGDGVFDPFTPIPQ